VKSRKFDLNTTLDFGKYDGYTISQLIEVDVSYVYWMLENFTDSEFSNEIHTAINDAIERNEVIQY